MQPVDANDIRCAPTVKNCTIKGFRNLLLQEALFNLLSQVANMQFLGNQFLIFRAVRTLRKLMIDGTTRMTLRWSPISTNRIPFTLSGYKPSCLVGTETSTSVTIANVNTTTSSIATGRTTTPWISQGWTGMYTLVTPSLSAKLIKTATRICQFSQYLGTKLDMLFEIAK